MKAKYFAIAAHEAVGQKRKYTGEPYWTHPERVANLVVQYGGNVPQIEAAWLHDVVEDTGVSLGIINTFFGREVARLVQGLTNVSRPEDGNRAVRKSIDRGWISKQDSDVQFVKCCDIIDNVRDIKIQDPEFAVKYMAEKLAMLDGMSIKTWPVWIAARWECEQS